MLVPGITGSLMERLIRSRQGTSPQLLACLRFCCCFSKIIIKKIQQRHIVLLKIKKRDELQIKRLKGRRGESVLAGREETAAFTEDKATVRET